MAASSSSDLRDDARIEIVCDDEDGGLSLRVCGQAFTIVNAHQREPGPPVVLGESLGERANEILDRHRQPDLQTVLATLLDLAGRASPSSKRPRPSAMEEEPEEDEPEDAEEEEYDDDDDDGGDDAFQEDEDECEAMSHEPEPEPETPQTRRASDGLGDAEAFRRLQQSTGGRAISLSRCVARTAHPGSQ